MKKILLTGSSGFIGQYVLKYLTNCGYETICADRTHNVNLTNQKDVNNLPDVDIVIHLAAFTTQSYTHPLDVLRVNLLSTQYLIDRYAGKIDRFVLASTSETYAGAVDLFDWGVPTDESVPLVISDVTNPRWSYGGSKIANELQVIAAKHQLNQDYTIIRYHNLYGPGQKNQFIPDFAQRIKQNDLTLKGWDCTRSFMYIDDAAEATVKIIENQDCVNHIINLGSDEELSIKGIAEIILKESNVHGDLILEDAPSGSVKRRAANIDKMKNLLGFNLVTSLRDGIKKTLSSLKN